jgi:hypothetical protein
MTPKKEGIMQNSGFLLLRNDLARERDFMRGEKWPTKILWCGCLLKIKNVITLRSKSSLVTPAGCR